MNSHHIHRLLLAACLFMTCQLYATQIHVPVDQPTIQLAIDVSINGDTVVVAPGEYFENINMHGKNILLTSNYYLSYDYTDIESTIINGSTPVNADTASVILIISGEDENCIIQGFTITGGGGTIWLDEHGAGTYREGGGILMQYSSPTIRYNYIMDNHVTNETGVLSTGGGAMRCGDSEPNIHNNIIAHNEATGYGGGMVFNYCDHVMVQNNLVAYNTGGNDFGGGGIWATGSSLSQVVDLVNNTIVQNTAAGTGVYGGKGGGIFVFTISIHVLNSIIYGNTQSMGNQMYPVGGVITTTYSDIQGGAIGEGNIDADPVFLDTLMCFLTDTLSPCVDAGHADVLYNDIATVPPGDAAYPSLGTVRNDMGVYGGPVRLQLSECPAIEPPTTGIESILPRNLKVYPNPANDFIIFSMAGEYLITIYDIHSRMVFHENVFGKKVIDIQNWQSGIYSFSVSGLRNETGKFLIGE